VFTRQIREESSHMFELIFISTNQTKLAHFRHIAKRFGIRVSFFRRKTFLASYTEPQIGDREKLLAKSYKSALEQWEKSGLSESRSLFFFEDTSVRIAALSERLETPGVDVKYWMRKADFSKLDKKLVSKNNERNASVRSDIVVSLPKWMRLEPGNESGYKVFSAEVLGSIVATEHEFETNLAYPWLDNKSFNKWFVPEGEFVPLGALSIDLADQHDFRFNAFSKLVDWLRDVALVPAVVPKKRTQLELQLASTNLSGVVICGPSCAGKTTLAEYVRAEYGWYHFEASDFMYRELYERNGPAHTHSIATFARQILLDEPEIVSRQILEHVHARPGVPFVVTGFRAPEEVKHFLSGLPASAEVLLIYLDASADLRFERYLERKREDSVPRAAFDSRDGQQFAMGLERMCNEIEMIPVTNNEFKDAMYNRFNSLLDAQHLHVRKLKGASMIFTKFPNANPLEKAILLSLLDAEQKEAYFTTAEVAKLINKAGSATGVPKSKDNVSRYFNQDFYPYFEITIEQNKRRYRLSSTGRSEAILSRDNLHSDFLLPSTLARKHAKTS
jgi:inosine/xanthosine triphosphate pyrophosphatase family protein/adenylate kinase family enzyme